MDAVTPVLNGQVLQGVDAYGARWTTSELTGWWESPESTGNTYDNVHSDGGWIDEAFDSSRVLVAGGTVRGTDRPATREAVERLMAAQPLKVPRPFSVDEDGLVRYCLVRRQSKPVVVWESDTLVSWNVQLSAPGSRRFSGDGSSRFSYAASTGLPVSVSNTSAPLTPPFTVDAVVTSGSVALSNAGDATPPVVVTFAGPVVGPVLRTVDGGLMRFDVSLDAGQTLVVDLDRRTVKINGTVNRRNTLSGSWIVPEAGTILLFDASVYNSAAQMTVQWSDAWS